MKLENLSTGKTVIKQGPVPTHTKFEVCVHQSPLLILSSNFPVTFQNKCGKNALSKYRLLKILLV